MIEILSILSAFLKTSTTPYKGKEPGKKIHEITFK